MIDETKASQMPGEREKSMLFAAGIQGITLRKGQQYGD
jgi:hypothetical protein